MIQIDNNLIEDLFLKAEASDRKRMNYDLRTSAADGSQRMLNALLPGTNVPVHRHPRSTENVFCLKGKLVEVLYEEVDAVLSPLNGDEALAFNMGMDAQDVANGKRLKEVARYELDPLAGVFGCVIPVGTWHTMEVLEPSVIYESKDGAYGADGSEVWREVQ